MKNGPLQTIPYAYDKKNDKCKTVCPHGEYVSLGTGLIYVSSSACTTCEFAGKDDEENKIMECYHPIAGVVNK